MGDYKEFKKHYSEHLRKIYKYVFFRVGRNKAMTEDLVSEIFLKALEHFDQFDNSRPFTAWIYGITKNHLSDHYRKNKVAVDLDKVSNIIASNEDISEKTNAILESEQLNKALETLREEKRELIELRYLSGFSFKEISEVTDKEEVNLRVTIHRTLKELKTQLEHLQ